MKIKVEVGGWVDAPEVDRYAQTTPHEKQSCGAQDDALDYGLHVALLVGVIITYTHSCTEHNTIPTTIILLFHMLACCVAGETMSLIIISKRNREKISETLNI